MDKLNKINNVLIKDSERAILSRYGINVDKCQTIDEVLLLIDHYLNDSAFLDDDYYEELDYIANNLAERKYYWESHK